MIMQDIHYFMGIVMYGEGQLAIMDDFGNCVPVGFAQINQIAHFIKDEDFNA
jgi:hypothetical protein